jgi:hypothetical protein
MNAQRFQVQPLQNARSFERNDIVTRPFYGTKTSAISSPWRVVVASGLILGLGLYLASQVGKKAQ